MPASHGGKYMAYEWGTRAEKIFMPMPLFHAAGMILLLKLTLAFGATFALTIPDRPLSSDLVLQSLKHAGAQGTILPHVILEELSTKSESLAELAKVKYMGFGEGKSCGRIGLLSDAGHTLTISVGNLGQQSGKTLIDNGVLLTNGIAATEYVFGVVVRLNKLLIYHQILAICTPLSIQHGELAILHLQQRSYGLRLASRGRRAL